VHTTIVSVDELASHLNDATWVIVDCRHLLQDFDAGRRMYEAAHIPGAFNAHGEEDLAGAKTGKNGRHPLPDVEEFITFLRDLGVNDDTQIVAYDAGADMWAARFWYVCRYIGHDAVAVLDGGFAAWTGMNKPISAQIPKSPKNGTIQARIREELAVDAGTVLQSLQSKEFSLIDARGADRFQGQNETVDPVGGHIPGAINRPFRSNYTGPFGQFKKPEELRSDFQAIGIAPERIVHQCGSGVSATVNLLAMEIAGMPGTRVYPGSWSEWCADPSRPMVRL
jgi:thiosulfate/3-mercaptopyruvate sulfurtransferase